jgi:hypothetical protein
MYRNIRTKWMVDAHPSDEDVRLDQSREVWRTQQKIYSHKMQVITSIGQCTLSVLRRHVRKATEQKNNTRYSPARFQNVMYGTNFGATHHIVLFQL